MSQRRRAQLGLMIACILLIATIAVLFTGNRGSLTRRAKASGGVILQVTPVQEVDLVAIGAK